MSLKCCNKDLLLTQVRYFRGDNDYPVRYLEWGVCPKCGTNKAILHRENNNGEYKPLKPNKSKNALSFVKDLLQKEQFYEFILLRVKHGTKSNMYYKYNDNGSIKDFNGEKVGSCKTPLFLIKL